MVTAMTALLIASLVGGVFGSVATYTYVDETDGKYCDQMSSENKEDSEELSYGEDEQGVYDPYDGSWWYRWRTRRTFHPCPS